MKLLQVQIKKDHLIETKRLLMKLYFKLMKRDECNFFRTLGESFLFLNDKGDDDFTRLVIVNVCQCIEQNRFDFIFIFSILNYVCKIKLKVKYK